MTPAEIAAQGEARAAKLLDVLALQRVEENLYLGTNEDGRSGRLFGGLVMAQAARAAYRTVEGVNLHSLHGYFMRAGDSEQPVLYEIERIRDGKSFVTRRVVAIQHGQAIFNMDVSFQIDEPGFDHALPMPNVPLPDDLTDDVIVAQDLTGDPRMSPMAFAARPFEARSVFRPGTDEWASDRHWNPTWLRFRGHYDPADQDLARCLLAYVSDMGLVSTASLPTQEEVSRHRLQMASLDHALWIHRTVRMDDWLLFHKRTSTSQGARGLVHADFFSAGGELIASVTQEGLIRLRREA